MAFWHWLLGAGAYVLLRRSEEEEKERREAERKLRETQRELQAARKVFLLPQPVDTSELKARRIADEVLTQMASEKGMSTERLEQLICREMEKRGGPNLDEFRERLSSRGVVMKLL